MMNLGPVQILVIGFDGGTSVGAIHAELDRLRGDGTIRMIDVIAVRKNDQGMLERFDHTDLDAAESQELGALVGALIGMGADGVEGARTGAELGAALAAEDTEDDQESWYVDDTIPPGWTAVVALVEHRWAIGLRDEIRRANGDLLAEGWVHPSDLIAVGESLVDTVTSARP
jgi:uncharacterized membrane protein